VPGQVGGCSRRRRGGDIHVLGRVEAGDIGLVEGGGGDIGDIGAGVEGLVLRAVEVGRVLDLDGRIGAGADGGGRVGDGNAGVAWVELGDGRGAEGREVGLGFGVCVMGRSGLD
jgi:hypothetical protein